MIGLKVPYYFPTITVLKETFFLQEVNNRLNIPGYFFVKRSINTFFSILCEKLLHWNQGSK